MSYNPVIVDGYELPSTKAEESCYSVIPNDVWSQNAGRKTADGTFVGDIVAVKYTVKYTVKEMTQSQVTDFENAVLGKTFHTVEFHDPKTGQSKTITAYKVDMTYTIKKFRFGDREAIYENVTFEMIEQ